MILWRYIRWWWRYKLDANKRIIYKLAEFTNYQFHKKKKKHFRNCRINRVQSLYKTSSGSGGFRKQETSIFLLFYLCSAKINRSKINLKSLKMQNLFLMVLQLPPYVFMIFDGVTATTLCVHDFWRCYSYHLMCSWFFFETSGQNIEFFLSRWSSI